jgi:hypothetical protein
MFQLSVDEGRNSDIRLIQKGNSGSAHAIPGLRSGLFSVCALLVLA